MVSAMLPQKQVAMKAEEKLASVELSAKQPNCRVLLGEGRGNASPVLYNVKGDTDLWAFQSSLQEDFY